MLKIEKVNYDDDHTQVEMFGHAISAKRYVGWAIG